MCSIQARSPPRWRIILGLPAVAVSLTEGDESQDFIYAAEFICDLIPSSLPKGFLKGLC